MGGQAAAGTAASTKQADQDREAAGHCLSLRVSACLFICPDLRSSSVLLVVLVLGSARGPGVAVSLALLVLVRLGVHGCAVLLNFCRVRSLRTFHHRVGINCKQTYINIINPLIMSSLLSVLAEDQGPVDCIAQRHPISVEIS